MLRDDWLDRWLPLLTQTAGPHPVLEIGCGHGDDTAPLAGAGLAVVAFDLQAAAAEATQRRVPAARVSCQDVRDPFPLAAGSAGAVVASLTLHYFAWAETVALVQRIHTTLRPGGLLLCRLNSTADRHFGAEGHPEIEPGLYRVEGNPKRFFDEPAVDRLFATGWDVLSKEHRSTRKYVLAKALWEVVLRRREP